MIDVELLTDRSRAVLANAQSAARHCRHARVEAPHLLLGILRHPDSKGGAALHDAGLNYRDVLVEVQATYEQAQEPTSDPLPLGAETEAVLDGALREAVREGRPFVETAHLALACSRPEGAPSIARFVSDRERAVRDGVLRALRRAASVEAQQRSEPLSRRRRIEALNRADDMRMRRAQLKRDLVRGRVSMRSILIDPPECVQTARLLELLLVIPSCGPVKATKLLAQCSIPGGTALGELSQRQRDRLINLL